MGDGPIDVIVVASPNSQLDYIWQYPPYVNQIERFAAFSRYAFYDKRGCGLSDRTVEPPTIAEDVSDAISILDELQIERAHLWGTVDGGSAALALAATHPDRVAKVAVYEATCCAVATEDFPWAVDRAEAEALESSGVESG